MHGTAWWQNCNLSFIVCGFSYFTVLGFKFLVQNILLHYGVQRKRGHRTEACKILGKSCVHLETFVRVHMEMRIQDIYII